MKDHAVVVGENPHPGGAAVLCLVDRAAVHVGLDLVRVDLGVRDREEEREGGKRSERERDPRNKGEKGARRRNRKSGGRRCEVAKPRGNAR